MTYANISELHFDQTVYLDKGFTCVDCGPTVLYERNGNLCFACREGDHNLEGQIDDEEGFVVGVYLEPNEYTK